MPMRILIVVLLAALTAGAIAGNFYKQSAEQAYLARYTQTVQILARAVSDAANQSTHPSGAIRPDLSTVNTASLEARQDAWGRTLRICINALEDRAPMILALSAGRNGNHDTSCTEALSGELNADDQLSSLEYEQVFARQSLTTDENLLLADYTNRCTDSFDLLEKDSLININCRSMCQLFQRFSERYGFHDTAPDWASCERSNN